MVSRSKPGGYSSWQAKRRRRRVDFPISPPLAKPRSAFDAIETELRLEVCQEGAGLVPALLLLRASALSALAALKLESRVFGRLLIARCLHLQPCRETSQMFTRSSNACSKPVALPPGRARLAAMPAPTGSVTFTNTIRMVLVARCSGPTPKPSEARMTIGRERNQLRGDSAAGRTGHDRRDWIGRNCRVAPRTFTSGLSQVGSRTGAPV